MAVPSAQGGVSACGVSDESAKRNPRAAKTRLSGESHDHVSER